ncbi:hypothetical protein [Micromonospora sp. NPDC047730]|uniref:hypothetical protein n=1 Tax=Micromonospora sp. NPDC047730 TaxID=3364253 RepID=UPI003723C23F
MTARELAALIRHAVARLERRDPPRADRVTAEHALSLYLAEALTRGLVRELSVAGRAALDFTYRELERELADAALFARLTELEKETPK